jgi:hypothetical protein
MRSWKYGVKMFLTEIECIGCLCAKDIIRLRNIIFQITRPALCLATSPTQIEQRQLCNCFEVSSFLNWLPAVSDQNVFSPSPIKHLINLSNAMLIVNTAVVCKLAGPQLVK